MNAALVRSALREGREAAPNGAARRAAPRHDDASASLAFGINGRFLTRSITGVQRYGHEIVGALDALLDGGAHAVSLFTPQQTKWTLHLRNIAVRPLGPSSGHVWEQCTLPLRHGLPLLNLCNTAPVMGFNRVVCIHDANVFVAPESYGMGFRIFYKALQPWIARRSTCVATVSENAASQIARHLDVPLARINVVPNGHEHALRWDASRSTLRHADAIRRPFVVLLGSLARHKNIGRILNLADTLDQLGLDIKVVGAGAAIFQHEDRRPAANVTFLGPVCDDDLAFLLSHALCLAFPSINEGFGIPLLEAMVCGCPIVASNSSSIPEVCGNAALFADPHDDALWVKHFAALVDSTNLSTELRERGRERALRFSWAQSARQYLDMMKDA